MGISCQQRNNREHTTYGDFPREISIEGYTVELDTALFRYPYNIHITNSKALVHDLHNADNYFHLFNYPDFSYSSSFGKRGEGPREMVMADHFVVTGDTAVWLVDGAKSLVTRLILDDELSVAEAIKLDVHIMRAFDWQVYNDSTFVLVDFSGESRLIWVNREGEIIRKTGQIPTVRNGELRREKPFSLSLAWRVYTDYNPRNGIMAAVTQFGEVLEIFDLKNDSCHVEYGPLGEPRFGLMATGSILPINMGFQSVKVTDEYIYAVFSGVSYEDYVEAAQTSDSKTGGNYLHVYTLQGKPVCRYVLDRRIGGFDIDTENDLLIGLSIQSDQPVVVFKLANSNCLNI